MSGDVAGAESSEIVGDGCRCRSLTAICRRLHDEEGGRDVARYGFVVGSSTVNTIADWESYETVAVVSNLGFLDNLI